MKARYIDNTIVSKGATAAGWLFGEPVLRAGGVGWAKWNKGNELTQTQKGGGWSAELYGGVQTGDDWAACYIPVNELPLTQLTSADWSWYQTATEVYGLGIVVWLHDPDDFDKRAEISQSGSATSLDKAAGQNSHEFPSTAAEFFFYGEGTTASALTAGTLYTWAQFQADVLFSTWSIYRISFENGWYSTGTFESMFLEEVKLNGMYISLKPVPEGVVGHNKTGLGHGVMTVTTAGTDLVLAATTEAKVVIIQAQTDNTGVIAIGVAGVDATVATGTGVALYAGDSVTLEIDDLADIFVDATVSGEGVRYTYLT